MSSKKIGINIGDLYLELKNELRRESDRGSVVLAVAWIDEYLTEFLKSFLCQPINNNKDRLFKVGGPIGDFGIKIDLAYRLGLIRQVTCRSLHLFRRLRNDFAHLASQVTLETPAVKDRIAEILKLNKTLFDAVWEDLTSIEEIRNILTSDASLSGIPALEKVISNKAIFEMAAAFTVSYLKFAASSIKRLPLLDDVDEIDGKAPLP
jgi:DNA-binding MltR family transcriptional regulator